jgi:hypothetical protein
LCAKRGKWISSPIATNYSLVTLQHRLSYMVTEAPDKVRQFVEIGGSFPGILLGSCALTWMMPGKVLGDIVMLRQLYLAAKPSHVGLMWIGQPAPYTILPPMGVRLACIVPCQILLFFTWSPSFS